MGFQLSLRPPDDDHPYGHGIGVVLVKTVMSRTIEKLGKMVNSRALEGGAWHHRSDAITTGAAAGDTTIALIGGPGWEWLTIMRLFSPVASSSSMVF